MIEIVDVTNDKAGMLAFVKFPFSLYKGSKYWVPPIIADELAGFDASQNPVFKHATGQFFLAKKEGKTVGRIAVLLNKQEIEQQGIKKVRFGWYDVIDDLEVSKALLNKATEIGQQHQLEYVEGPMGFSNMDKVGVMTYGYDHIGTMITWYNHPYYVQHLESLGFTIEKEYLENKFYFENLVNMDKYEKAADLVKKRYQLQSLNFTKTSQIMPYVDEMFDLFNKSYAGLSSFVAMTEEQKAYFKKKYINFINPEYIKFVCDAAGKLLAFAIIMPSFSEALQKANGKLFPFGFLHLLHAKYFSKTVNFYLIGIDPDYQNKGLTAIIFTEFYKVCKAKGIKTYIRTPELANNTAIAAIWKDFSPVTHQKRCTYRKNLK